MFHSLITTIHLHNLILFRNIFSHSYIFFFFWSKSTYISTNFIHSFYAVFSYFFLKKNKIYQRNFLMYYKEKVNARMLTSITTSVVDIRVLLKGGGLLRDKWEKMCGHLHLTTSSIQFFLFLQNIIKNVRKYRYFPFSFVIQMK